ncbi:hypothetical protein AAHH87_00300 [Candidatus Hodgkinia cicadicola]
MDTALCYLGFECFSAWNRCVVITRLSKKSITNSKLFGLESLSSFKPLLALYLSVRLVSFFCKLSASAYGLDCPVLCVFKSSWAQEAFLLSSLRWLRSDIRRTLAQRIVLLIVGKALMNCTPIVNRLTR